MSSTDYTEIRRCECCGNPSAVVAEFTIIRDGADSPEHQEGDTIRMCAPCHAGTPDGWLDR